jgi:anti-anti-sigma factor
MTIVQNANTSGGLNPVSVCGDGVYLSSQTRGGATVVAVTGEIDASNIHHLTDYAQHHLGAGRPVVIDLTGLDFLGAQGIPALLDINGRCGDAGVEWSLVPSHAVSRLLRICDVDGLPVVSSVDEALEHFSSPGRARRLLKLVTKTS